MKINLSFLYLILLFACTPEPSASQDNVQTISANIDGIAFKATKDPNDSKNLEEIVTNQVTFSSGLGFVLAFAGADFSLEGVAVTDVRLVLIGPDLAMLKPGTIINTRGTDSEPPHTSLKAAGITSMVLPNEETAYEAETDDFGDIEVIITAFDPSAKRISGTFEFTAVDPDENRTVVVTGGEFKNISW